jgi:AcrR family transcriptional regulator
MRSPAPSPASSDKVAARQRILDAAARDFLASGFRNVTMDDLAGELGMSKKTLYAHFSGKRDLIEAMLLERFRAIEAEFELITSPPGVEFAEALQRLLACMQRRLDAVRPPFLRDIQREYPELFKVIDKLRSEMIQRHLGGLLAKGRREGVVRKDVPVHLVMEILLAALHAIVNPNRLLELGLTPERGVTTILSVLMEGVLTRDKEATS